LLKTENHRNLAEQPDWLKVESNLKIKTELRGEEEEEGKKRERGEQVKLLN